MCVTTPTVPEAAEAVSSGRTGKPDALSRKRTAITWRSLRKRIRHAIYIIYPIAEIMEEMNCGKNKAVQLLDELENKVGLIERKRQGLGNPNLIYVRSFFRTVDNSGERHFLKFENKTSG
ncbi:MAG: hypothetical protein IJG63_01750, partial [Oscillospiraceae bacterium]|nr:hypothetical protein [Oscillospiraceae bacterium]